MASRPSSRYVAPAMLVVAGALVRGNWYVRPERAIAWTAVLVLLGVMALVLSRFRHDRDPEREAAAAYRTASVRNEIAFAGAMMVCVLGGALAIRLGVVENQEIARRLTMAMMGAFFVFAGNYFPKKLTPLSALTCDVAKVQAFQRLVGWTWVLTGLAFAIVWIVLPIPVARPLSMLLIVGAAAIVARGMLNVRQARA